MSNYKERAYGKDSVGLGEKLGIAVVDFQRAFTDPVCVPKTLRPSLTGCTVT